MKRLSIASIVLLAATVALAFTNAACSTTAYCFGNCDDQSSGGNGGSRGGFFEGGSGAGGSPFGGLEAAGGGFGTSGSAGTGGAGGSCRPTNAGLEACDGIDNNCDGQVDEGYDHHDPRFCGTCENNCYTVLPNANAQSVTCTWSGIVHEAGTCSFGSCAQDWFDLDHDPSNGCEYACAKIAENDITCDNRDDNCNGVKDEGVNLCSDPKNCGVCGRSCNVFHGAPACEHDGDPSATCGAADTRCVIQACEAGWWDIDRSYATGCEYRCELTNGGVEVCGDGIDNDCDGAIDAADSDLSGDMQLGKECFGAPSGECATHAHAGTTTCVGQQVLCKGPGVLAKGDVAETCNGLDDDCDGIVDNNPTDAGKSCGVSNAYPCTFGVVQCLAGALACAGNVDPKAEACNGIDDDCDGHIDSSGGQPPPDSVGACNVPPPPPPGATSPCKGGQKACVGGVVRCQGSVLAAAVADTCGVDANCDGTLTGQPNTASDVHNCGGCGIDCGAGLHELFACQNSACVFKGCQTGYYDLNGDGTCEYACTFASANEACNGVDDNCNGQIDEGAANPPSPTQLCGVSPSAKAAECTTQVSVTCVQGAWTCAFPAGVCSPSCASAVEVCDALDNNCNGVVNENVPNFGKPCASDDGAPVPGDGACRTTGAYICNGPGATKCSATKADCATLFGGCDEACDGVDNDCDGLVDEPFSNKGSNAAYFVKPAVTKVASSTWIYSYEASRPDSTAVVPGQGNGYACAGVNATDPNCNVALPAAPAGVTLDKTPACSTQGRIPWFNVTPAEVEQACYARGGHVCSTTDWQLACTTKPPSSTTCLWGYAPRGLACTSSFVAGSKFCNLGPSYDFDRNPSNGTQNGLLPAGSPFLQSCYADFSGQLGNVAGRDRIYDITGNLREITKRTGTAYALMGGSFETGSEDGAQCGFTFFSTNDPAFEFYDTGFRCCFSADPTQ